ncbi:MAG: hypothetical protein RL456_339 [Pseudomonadota bacterium]|jgi:general secretion pathway protein G
MPLAPSVPAPGRRPRGFTLVELMLGIGVLSVLMMIAMPFWADHRERVRQRQAATDIGAMSVRILQYHEEERRFPATLATVGMDDRRDPWGQPYQYYNIRDGQIGDARKDRSLVPINSDFDLYSLGKDGASARQLGAGVSQDDVIRAANGTYVGIASGY